MPTVSLATLLGRGNKGAPSILNAGMPTFYTSGRAALANALLHANIHEGQQVLLPAYNCRAMVEPVVWTGAEPVLYRINEDLSVCIDDLELKINKKTMCLIVVHYFGFPQNIRRIDEFCKMHNILLIEDCAHAFFGGNSQFQIGGSGDYSIASLVKFFPIFDGGCLVIKNSNKEIPTRNSSIIFELKAFINILEYALQYKRFHWANRLLRLPFIIKDFVWRIVKKFRGNSAHELVAEPTSSSTSFDESWKDVEMSKASTFFFRKAKFSDIVQQRRENYKKLLSAFQNQPGCRVVIPYLPENVAPYVFPLFVDKPDVVFHALKSHGVPLYRWEDIDDGICDVASTYKDHLLQLPCHQSLTESEIHWVIDTVLKITREK